VDEVSEKSEATAFKCYSGFLIFHACGIHYRHVHVNREGRQSYVIIKAHHSFRLAKVLSSTGSVPVMMLSSTFLENGTTALSILRSVPQSSWAG
jgi:hypothetical protein